MAPRALIKIINLYMIFSISLVAMIGPLTANAQAENLILTQAGPPQVLFAWETSSCSKNFIPDAPARMFRRADDTLMLLAPHDDNWAMTGPDFFNLKQQCSPVFPASSYDANVNGNLWIEATYTFDGKSVFGVASQDLSALEIKNGCDKNGSQSKCWVNALVGVRSDDMGNNFELQDQNNDVVASMGRAYQSDWTSREGFFTISNIVNNGPYYYAFVSMANATTGESGNCLIRTTSVEDSSSWRGWNGKEFTAPLRTNETATGNSCKIVGAGILDSEVRSLNFIPKKSLFVVVFRARLKLSGDATAIPGAYYATSKNLLDWTPPQRLFIAPTRPRVDSEDGFFNYPVLIDPSSKSQNFETIDSNHPVLIYTYEHLKNGEGTLNRDLDYVPLQLH